MAKRRDFLRVISLTSLALAPGANVIAGLFRNTFGVQTDGFIDESFRIVDHRNLMTAEFYFINVKGNKAGGIPTILKAKDTRSFVESYMIVRLPQQHIAEEYIESALLDPQVGNAREFYAATYISGYSYLVFKIFFNRITDAKGNLTDQLAINVDELMNWNAPWFRLVVRQNMQQQLFELLEDDPDEITASGAGARTVQNKKSPENEYPLGFRYDGTTLVFNKEHFPRVNGQRKKLLDPAPVTAIEAPYKLILSPQLPDQDNYRFKWTFSANVQSSGSSKDGESFELWMATLFAEKIKRKLPTTKETRIDNSADLPLEEINQGDNHLRLMIIGKGENTPDKLLPADNKNDILQRHKTDLVDLYFKYRITARTPKMSFTPLGICTDIEFKNKLYETTIANSSISLFSWKQSISFGRDQKVEVSHVVVESCFGLKMLHIKKTKRETYKGASVLVYREYLMPLELEKDYTLYDNNDNSDRYNNPNWKCNSPFRRVEFAEKEAKQIMPIRLLNEFVVRSGEGNTLAFWALTTRREFIEWPFKVTDWHGNEHICRKKIFVLTSEMATGNESASAKEEAPGMPPQAAINQVFLLNMREEERVALQRSEAKTSIQTLEQQIERKLDDLSGPASAQWMKLLRLSEEFDLKKLDFYTSHLEALLGSIESRLRQLAGNIEDKVIEEWNVFKLHILEQEEKLFKVVDDVLLKLEIEKKRFDELVNDVNISAAYDKAWKELKAKRDALTVLVKENAGDLQAKLRGKVQEIREYIGKELLDAIPNDKDILADLRRQYTVYAGKLTAFIEAIDQGKGIIIGYEQECRQFLEKLPGRFRDQIKNVIATEMHNLRNCSSRIRIMEDQLRARVDFARARIGYAPYFVEEELEKLKTKLKEEFSDQWEEKYNKLRQAYHDQLNANISRFETEFMVLKGNLRHVMNNKEQQVLDFFNEYTCFPQLHTAKAYVKSINDLVNKEIPVKFKYAEDYIRNQVDDLVLDTRNNVSRVFAEIKSDAKQYVSSAVREISKDLGGIVNPDLAADFITYAKDVRAEAQRSVDLVLNSVQETEAALKDTVKELKDQANAIREDIQKQIGAAQQEFGRYKKEFDDAVDNARNQVMLIGKEAKKTFEQYRDLAMMEGKEFFKGLEAKILGAIHLKDILGEGFELPKLDRAGNKVYYRFITDKLKPVSLGPFSFDNKGRDGAKANMIVYFEKPLNGSGYTAWTSLNNFAVGIFSNRVIVQFEKLQVHSDQHTKNKVSVKISNVAFTQELAFLEALSKNIKIPGTGLSLSITPQDINVDFAYTLPGVSGGAFTMANLKFGVGVRVPLPIGARGAMEPISTRFGINAPDDKFVVAVGIWGGRGHFVLEATPKYIRKVDAGIDFGGYLGLNLGIARGEAYLMAGIRYVYSRDEMGDVSFELYCTLSCGGSVTVFGFITLSVVFLLCLRYQRYQGRTTLYGTATVTYSVKIGFFRKSFSLTFSRRLHGSEGTSQSREMGFRKNRPGEYMLYYAAYRPSDLQDLYYYAGHNQAYERKKRRLRDTYSTEQWKRMVRAYKLN